VRCASCGGRRARPERAARRRLAGAGRLADGNGNRGRDPYDFTPEAAERACLDAARRDGWDPQGTQGVKRLGPMAFEVLVYVQDGRRTKVKRCVYDADQGEGRLPR